jgi:hypothetical protein
LFELALLEKQKNVQYEVENKVPRYCITMEFKDVIKNTYRLMPCQEEMIDFDL